MPKPKKTARHLACHVLRRIEKDGAFSQPALSSALERSPELAPAERALLTRLVYGTLQWQGQLDYHLAARLRRPLKDTDPITRRVLRVGAFQLLHLHRVPGPAAVHAMVEVARDLCSSKVTGFVNAVLRRLYKDRDSLSYPDPNQAPLEHLTSRGSLPPWLASQWLDQLGLEEALELAQAINQVPPITLRSNSLRTQPEQLADRLRAEAQVSVRPSGRAPEGLIVEPFGGLTAHPSYSDGEWVVQDEASILVAHLVAPRPGEAILDACAAPGGKTCHMAALMEDRGHIQAIDLYSPRVARMEQTAQRLGITCISTQTADLLEASLSRPLYDRVLLDAPCSNIGTLRRHPEAKWRRRSPRLAELPRLQVDLLQASAARVRPDGILVYSVCSTDPGEGAKVMERFLESQPGRWVTEPPTGALWQGLVDERGWVATWPHRHGTDGFFAARLRRLP